MQLQPGPGHYQVSPSINPKGSYFVSKFRSSMCRTFGSEKRNSCGGLVSRATTPGPGTYRTASNFFSIARKQDVLKRAKILITTPRDFRVAHTAASTNAYNTPARKSEHSRNSGTRSAGRLSTAPATSMSGGMKHKKTTIQNLLSKDVKAFERKEGSSSETQGRTVGI